MIIIHSLQGGGAERVAVDLATYWATQGTQVTLVTQAFADNDAYALTDSVQRVVLGTAGNSAGRLRGLLANLLRVRKLRRLMQRTKPDVVLGMMTTSSILAVLAARKLPCRVVATEHTHPPVQKLPKVWQRLRCKAYPRAAQVVALTRGTALWLEENVPGSRVAVIPNAVRWPLEQTDPLVVPPERNGRYRLLAVGRLHRLKGFDVLIRAFAIIAGYFPQWDLVILGEGSQRDMLQSQVHAAGLAQRISLAGRVGNIGQWYAQSDLYVLSSRAEGLSNTLIEAMASGLAVIAFDCDTGPREVIRDGIDGVLVRPVEDDEALAAHLSDLMAHPQRRRALACRAVDARDRFSTARVMAMWQHVFCGDLRPNVSSMHQEP